MHELIVELQQYHKTKAGVLLDLESKAIALLETNARDGCWSAIQSLFEHFQSKSELTHHQNEELILTELLTTSAPIHRRVEQIAADHTAFVRITSSIERKLSDPDASRNEMSSDIRSFVQIYKDHANGEDMIFFPMADKYLENHHWATVRKNWT